MDKPPEVKDWPKEPYGFCGLKFLATKAHIEKIIKLESCNPTAEPINSPLETKAYKVELTLAGMKLEGSVQFTSPRGGPDSEGKLTLIFGTFGVANAETMKTAFVKMYGEPHLIKKSNDGIATFWRGNIANIILFSSEAGGGSFVLSPSEYKIGGVSHSNYFDTGARASMEVVGDEECLAMLKVRRQQIDDATELAQIDEAILSLERLARRRADVATGQRRGRPQGLNDKFGPFGPNDPPPVSAAAALRLPRHRGLTWAVAGKKRPAPGVA
jgi:hypothetical protein